ncbi:unnamed protein product [Durusdinium trenchii]|uniref:Pentatricopeptide repeat-containing protein n=1 Tax=Durusdinium trenchii TaxID=1381693 RepID=A0ABP0QK67_9DINO
MKRTCHTLVFSLLLLVHLCRECHKTFALIKQVGSYFLRQQSGLNIHSPAFEQRDRDVVFSKKELKTEGLGLDPTQEEKTLASLLKAAGDEKRGKNGKWQDMFAKYSGSNPIVVNAAMQAALKQRDYDEGLNIYYNRVRYMTLPTFSIAMKLLGKCGHLDEVERLWEELVGLNLVNQVLAAARIDAAADDGDMGGAESVLNYMVEKDIEANVVHFTSTIRACANAKEDLERAAGENKGPLLQTSGRWIWLTYKQQSALLTSSGMQMFA